MLLIYLHTMPVGCGSKHNMWKTEIASRSQNNNGGCREDWEEPGSFRSDRKGDRYPPTERSVIYFTRVDKERRFYSITWSCSKQSCSAAPVCEETRSTIASNSASRSKILFSVSVGVIFVNMNPLRWISASLTLYRLTNSRVNNVLKAFQGLIVSHPERNVMNPDRAEKHMACISSGPETAPYKFYTIALLLLLFSRRSQKQKKSCVRNTLSSLGRWNMTKCPFF